MKKVKRNLLVLMLVLMVPMMLVGCKPKVGPAESAKIWFNFAVKGDKSGLTTLGAPQNTVDDLEKTQKDNYIRDFKTTFLSQGLTITDQQAEEVFKAYLEALSKVSVTTEVVSESSKSAEVKVKSTYIDAFSLSQKAGTDAVNQYKNTDIKSQQELKTKLTEALINNLVTEFKNAKPSVATKEKSFKFAVKDKLWLPENELNYAKDICLLASGQ